MVRYVKQTMTSILETWNLQSASNPPLQSSFHKQFLYCSPQLTNFNFPFFSTSNFSIYPLFYNYSTVLYIPLNFPSRSSRQCRFLILVQRP